LDLSKTIDQHFPALGSNCAFKASTLKPSADGLWGWYLLIGDKTQSLVFGNMNNIV
jgi:hypothetical protein